MKVLNDNRIKLFDKLSPVAQTFISQLKHASLKKKIHWTIEEKAFF